MSTTSVAGITLVNAINPQAGDTQFGFTDVTMFHHHGQGQMVIFVGGRLTPASYHATPHDRWAYRPQPEFSFAPLFL